MFKIKRLMNLVLGQKHTLEDLKAWIAQSGFSVLSWIVRDENEKRFHFVSFMDREK